MASLNRVTLIGNVGKDCELRYLANGTPQGTFTLAVNRSYKAGDEWKQETEWANIVVWRDVAERAAQNVLKGKSVYVEGRLSTRSWDDDQGKKHYKTEIVAEKVMLLDKRDDAPQSGNAGRRAKPAQDDWATEPDDLPF